MGKRKRPSHNESMELGKTLSYEDENKRPQHEGSISGFAKEKPANYGRVDPNSGQRSAIPGLDDYSTENWDAKDLQCEDDETRDALKYLMSVRYVYWNT